MYSFEIYRQKLRNEMKEKKEIEQIKNVSLDYKEKFQKEWEQKLELESTVTSLEREIHVLRKRLEQESRMR